jgi:hypothetical protein
MGRRFLPVVLPFRYKYTLRGLFCPLFGDFCKFSFALVIQKAGNWQPPERNFPFTTYNTRKSEMDGHFPVFFSNTGKNQKRQMRGEIFPTIPYTDAPGFCQTDNEKSSKSFSDLLLFMPPVAVGYSVVGCAVIL